MGTIETSEETAKNQSLIDATEKIETVMGFYPQFQAYEPQTHTPEIAPGQTSGFMLLWLFVLLAQFLMFWQQKNR